MNTPQHDGGPAFPHHSHQLQGDMSGMSLRDWFAGMALQGILSNPKICDTYSKYTEEMAAQDSYATADAMIAARDQNQEDQ